MPQTLTQLLHLLHRQTVPCPDRVLLERFLGCRDEAAFTALVSRYGPMVLRLCRRWLRKEQDVEDTFQATFLVLARRASAIRSRDSLAAWLHGVAYRVASRARTADSRQQLREAPGPDLNPPDPHRDPLDELTARELLTVVDEEVQRLPQAYRLPVLLCCLEGKSQEEAARLLGWTPGSVKGRLGRGRQRLQERLVRRGLTLSAALAAVAIGQGAASAVPPAALASATVRAAVSFAAGSGAAGAAISSRLLVLAEEGMKGLAVAKVKVGAALVLLTGVLVGGVGLATHQAPTAKPPASGGKEIARPTAKRADQPKPGGGEQGRTDHHGDLLPPGALARMGTLRFRHWAPLNSAAYSPDGKLLATAGTADNQVRLWEAATGRLLAAVPGNGTVVFTHDGQRLFYCGSNTNAESKLLNIGGLREEESPIFAVNSKCMALSPDGRCLALNTWKNQPPHEVRVCDVTTGKVRLRLTGHQKPVSCLAYSPDGKTIVTAGDEAIIRLWDAATGKLLLRLDGHRPVDGYRDHMLAVTFSPDGKQLVSGGMDQTVRLWDVAAGKEVRRLGEHKGGVLCVAFTPDGGQVLTGGLKEPIRLWDAATGKEVRHYPKRSEFASQMAFAPGGKTMAVVHWGYYTPRFWDVANGREVVSADGPELEVTGIVFSRDSRTVTTAGLDEIRRWETDTGRELRRWELVPRLLECLASSPDGQTLAFGDAFGTICLWQANTGRELRRLKGPKGWVLGLAFAPDGKALASASHDGTVRLWDIATGTELRCFTGHERDARGVAFSPDGKTLATTAHDQTVRLWRVDTGEELRRLKTLRLQNNAVAISPDGRLLFVGSGGERPIQVWELATGRELPPFTLPRYQERIFSFGFSSDGRTLASGGEDGVVRLWEVTSRQERRRFTGHTGWAYRVLVAPDGKRLASASNDTTTVVWDLTTPSADERRLAAGLTEEQAKALWADLASDAERADRAIRVLTAAKKQAVPFLQRQLRPVAPVRAQRLARLIADLDSETFQVRQQATEELERLGEQAEPALRKALAGKPELEVRRRLEQLVEKLTEPVPSPDRLRALRAVEVLEHIGTMEAQGILESWAKGALEARLTQEAKASLERMARQPDAKP
ncbi:MAG TPA: sigma-70 family RNA polymerase sigma factor [Gemmataceae bacterium]|jgi:RNA polymerase sigma factor (sigma-70 family)